MSDTEDEEIQSKIIKITLVGEPGTGKTSLCNRYLGGSGASGSTHGAEVTAGQCLGLRPPVQVQLCDVAGNTLSTTMLGNYLYASDIIIFVYDLTNLASFEKLNEWVEKVEELYKDETDKPLMAMFGNKSDLEHQRAVRLSSVTAFGADHSLEKFKGSARTGEMVNAAFTTLIARVMGAKVTSLVAPVSQLPVREVPERENQPQEEASKLIMNRAALRQVQKKESTSVCVVH
ncbi:ras-related protein Rab-28-like [Leptidea sinapis]|uniref:ras-related protein Rab-28-like n=1 Tax=Leptidea sinapis TaxID=189913 RepID=UPI0021C303AC|nr:ras-related protein Rab-28-like [Leptidea sinapis]